MLIRALKPEDGLDTMRSRRGSNRSDGGTGLKSLDMTNGPSKLTQALGVNKANSNKLDLTTSTELWIEDGPAVEDDQILACPRINIDYAEEWADKLLRFYIKDNDAVSVLDKKLSKVMWV